MRRTLWAGALLALTLGGCREPTERKLPTEAIALPIAALDTMKAEGELVSINGVIVLPSDGTRFVLDDGTGRVHVRLPEALPLPVQARLAVQGTLQMDREGRFVDARIWLYDSTAVPVRSPGIQDRSR